MTSLHEGKQVLRRPARRPALTPDESGLVHQASIRSVFSETGLQRLHDALVERTRRRL